MHQEIDITDEAATDEATTEEATTEEATAAGHTEQPREPENAPVPEPWDVVLDVLMTVVDKLEQQPKAEDDELPADVPRFVRS
jgi:hypothetical protein